MNYYVLLLFKCYEIYIKMKTTNILNLIIAFLVACISCIAPNMAIGELPPLIPMRDFFRNPQVTNYQISPNGKYIAFLKPWETRLNIHVQSIGKTTIKRVTSVTERDIHWFHWANDNRLVYPLDKGGDENYHIYAINRDGSDLIDLTPYSDTRAMLINLLKYNSGYMLITINNRDKRHFDAYKVNVFTGDLELLVENPGNISNYFADHEGKLRLATTSDGVNTSILYRETSDDEFKVVLTTNFREGLEPKFFTYDNRYIYASSNLGRDKQAIVVFDPATATEIDKIYEHPDVDVWAITESDKRKIITGVGYFTDKRHYSFFDEKRRNMQLFLESKLPGVDVNIMSENLEETRHIVRTFSDKTLGDIYIYESEKNSLTHLSAVSPWITADYMAEMEPISYKSRDDLTIHGYLTLPKGVEPKNLPVVINPHGGPWGRDFWGFRSTVQFLANRGYAVLQMNFRGSTGYGRKFWELSFKQWGRTMQNDVSDGVKWLIEEGIADPERVGIYGGSYGGYTTLAGITFTPELYTCAVDYVGISNLLTFFNTIPPYWDQYRAMFYEMVGNPDTEIELLKAASPVFHVDNIRAPLLIAQGANDPRVNKAESDQIVDALKKRGIDVPYMVKDNEGHGFSNEENRFEFYRAMEQFFAKHLGGRVESGDDILSQLY